MRVDIAQKLSIHRIILLYLQYLIHIITFDGNPIRQFVEISNPVPIACTIGICSIKGIIHF